MGLTLKSLRAFWWLQKLCKVNIVESKAGKERHPAFDLTVEAFLDIQAL